MKVAMIEKISQARIPVDALVEISWTFLFLSLISSFLFLKSQLNIIFTLSLLLSTSQLK